MALLKEGMDEWEKKFIHIDLFAETWPTEKQPYFIETVKDWDWYRQWDKYKWVSWVVKKVEKNPQKWKRDIIKWIKIYLEDVEDGTTIVVKPTLKQASKNLVNACLWSIWKEIVLKPFLNAKWYPDVYATVWGERSPTKFEYNDQDLMDKIWEACSEPQEKEAISPEDIPF